MRSIVRPLAAQNGVRQRNVSGHSVRMAERETELEYKRRFIERVTEIQNRQWDEAMANRRSMGIPQDNTNSMRPGA